MGIPDPFERAKGVLARTQLASGYTVSTARIGAARYETAVFSPGWPEAGDAVSITSARTLGEALTHHAAEVRRWLRPPPLAGVILTLA